MADIDMGKGLVRVKNTKNGTSYFSWVPMTPQCLQAAKAFFARVDSRSWVYLFHYGSGSREGGRGKRYLKNAHANVASMLNTAGLAGGFPPAFFSPHSFGSGFHSFEILKGQCVNIGIQDASDLTALTTARWKAKSRAQLGYVCATIGTLLAALKRLPLQKVRLGSC